MAVENGLKMKPSLSQSSPSGFPVWCYCSLLRLSSTLFGRYNCSIGTGARDNRRGPDGFLGANIRECRLDSVQYCRSDGDSARPPSERPIYINRRTRLREDASVSLAHLGQLGGRCRRAEESARSPSPARGHSEWGPPGRTQHDKRVVTFLFSETCARPNITVALAARRLHARSADQADHDTQFDAGRNVPRACWS